jgi:predicted transcriptional regulator
MNIELTSDECKNVILVSMDDIANNVFGMAGDKGIDIDYLSRESTIDIDNLKSFLNGLSETNLVEWISDKRVKLTSEGHELLKKNNSLTLSQTSFLVLQKTYEIYMRGDYDDSIQFNSYLIGCYLGITNHSKINAAVKILIDNAYCINPAIMSDFIIYFISVEGINYMENERGNSEDRKQVSVTNNFYADVSNSQIQQFTNHAIQNMTSGIDMNTIQNLIKVIEDNYGNIDGSSKEKIVPIVETIKTEIVKDKPDNNIIKQCFKTVKNILEGIVGNVVAAGILYHLNLFQ